MLVDVLLPKIGMAMQDAFIVEWVKKPGEAVTKGEILLHMETEKVIMELESPETGVLEEILVAEDEHADVGAILARIRVSS